MSERFGAARKRQDASADRTHAAILDAAITVIARHGLSATTVQLVAEAARVAPGTVILHFVRKEALLAAALEFVALEFEQARRQAIERASSDPVEAIKGLIEVSFDPKVSAPARIAVWYAFWGEAPARRVYQQVIGNLDNAYHADLERLFRELIECGGHRHLNPAAVAIGFAGLLDWHWQDVLSSGPDFDRVRAMAITQAYLVGIFPREFALTTSASPGS
ncbi:MAG: TetR family transcriptional regulator [Dongiaceae bacterium]